MSSQEKPRLVVIGNGMAGMRTVEELLAIAPDRYRITFFGDEPHGNYNRVLLSALLTGEKDLTEIITHDRAWYAGQGIELNAGNDKAIIGIDRTNRRVHARDGSTAAYDRLLIATGSKAVIADIPGNGLDGIISFRDISDVETMLAYAQSHRHAVVLGGGLLGLEAANGLAVRGMDVTVAHNRDLLLNRQLDRPASQLLQAELTQKGLRFQMNAKISALLDDGNGHVAAVELADGSRLPCDLFVMAIGIRPNIRLAQTAGLYCEQGIVVNDALQTLDESIYAVGECIQHRGETFGLVAPLFEQAKVCANHLSGLGTAHYMTLPTATKLKVTGINLFSVGDFLGAAGTESIYYHDAGAGIYKKLVVKDDRLVGAVLYGDTADGFWYQTLLEQRRGLADIREGMIFGPGHV